MHFCFRNCTYILTRTQGMFEDMFLVKIASKGTSFIEGDQAQYGVFEKNSKYA